MVNFLSSKIFVIGMRKIILILAVALMLLTVGCKPKVETGNGLINLPDVSKEDVEKILEEKTQQAEDLQAKLGSIEAAFDEPALPSGQFKLADKQSMAYGENKVTVKTIATGPLVDVDVDGTTGRLVETKSEEVINGLVISIAEFKFKLKDSPENYVVLNIKLLELGENEHLLSKDETVSVGAKIVKMIEPRADGSVIVEVLPSYSGNERIVAGSSIIIDNLEISPVQSFTKDKTRKAYAIIKVVEQ